MSTLKWYVITGGPSSGKTTTINELSKLGFHTVPEAARILIDREKTNGKTLEQIRGGELESDFQLKVLKLKIEIENKTPKDEVVFFDRGIPDSIAYYEILGADSKKLKEFCKEKTYKKIFFLEQLPYKKDYARVEDEETANKISELSFKAYVDLEYEIMRIPAMSIEDRIKMILSYVD